VYVFKVSKKQLPIRSLPPKISSYEEAKRNLQDFIFYIASRYIQVYVFQYEDGKYVCVPREWKGKKEYSFPEKKYVLLTLTFKQDRDPFYYWKNVSYFFNKHFMQKLRRHYKGKKFSYFRVIEPHRKNPYPHIHVIIDLPYIPDFCEFFAKFWSHGTSNNQDIKFIRNFEEVREYVMKYVMKGYIRVEEDGENFIFASSVPFESLYMMYSLRLRRFVSSRDIKRILGEKKEKPYMWGWFYTKYAFFARYITKMKDTSLIDEISL